MCGGHTQHHRILAARPSFCLRALMGRNEEDVKKTSCPPGKPLELIHSLSQGHNLAESRSPMEAVINWFPTDPPGSDPQGECIDVYLGHHQAQDFKSITHLLDSYSYSLYISLSDILSPKTSASLNSVSIKMSSSSLFFWRTVSPSSAWNLSLLLWLCFFPCKPLRHGVLPVSGLRGQCSILPTPLCYF